MFLTHALMYTRGFYKFLSELSTRFKILLDFWNDKFISVGERTHL